MFLYNFITFAQRNCSFAICSKCQAICLSMANTNKTNANIQPNFSFEHVYLWKMHYWIMLNITHDYLPLSHACMYLLVRFFIALIHRAHSGHTSSMSEECIKYSPTHIYTFVTCTRFAQCIICLQLKPSCLPSQTSVLLRNARLTFPTLTNCSVSETLWSTWWHIYVFWHIPSFMQKELHWLLMHQIWNPNL